MTLSDIRTKKGREEYLYLTSKRIWLGLENDEAPSEARERLVENKCVCSAHLDALEKEAVFDVETTTFIY